MTPQEKRIHAAKLEAEAVKLRAEAEHESKQPQAVSPAAQPPDPPMTVIPERKVRKPGRFTHGQICSATKPEDVQKILSELKKKQGK